MSNAVILKNHVEVIEEFRQRFSFLHEHYGLTCTLKIHVILSHFSYYFEKTGKTLKHTSDEYLETCHSTLRKSEETHGRSVKRKLGTPIHKQYGLDSLNIYNSKRAGRYTPQRSLIAD